MRTRGYFEIGIYHGKNAVNVGTLWRSAYQMGAAGIFVIGKRYRKQASDTCNTPMHLPFREFASFDEFAASRPSGTVLVGVEMGGKPLEGYTHMERAIYLLGAEDSGIPEHILKQCNHVVSLSSVRKPSFNVAVAGSVVMYHRCFLTS